MFGLTPRISRATGPRAAEALLLPRDCVQYVDGRGYKAFHTS